MSNTNYLVFEDSNNVYDMKKINVFANGCEMPWTYYQTVINLGENGYDKLMENNLENMFLKLEEDLK